MRLAARPDPQATPRDARAALEGFVFIRRCRVGDGPSVGHVFAGVEPGPDAAGRLVPALAAAPLLASIESACVREAMRRLDNDETVVGTQLDVRPLAATLPGTTLVVRGRAEPADRRGLRFTVTVDDEPHGRRVATATVVLQVVDADRFVRRPAVMAPA